MANPILRYSPGGRVLVEPLTAPPSVTTFTVDEDESGVSLANPTPILDYAPGGGTGIGVPPQEISQITSDVEPLIDGQSYIDVVFATEAASDDWILIAASVVNTTDPAPLNVWAGIMTVKTTTGFRLQLNGIPDSDNYYLHWATTFITIGGGGGSSGGDGGGTGEIEMYVTQEAYSATITVDASTGDDPVLLIVEVGELTGDLTLGNPTNPTNRHRIEYVFQQDATGGHSLTLGSDFRIPSSSSLVSPITSANNPDFTAADSQTRLMVEYDEEDDKWDVMAFVPGYLP